MIEKTADLFVFVLPAGILLGNKGKEKFVL